MPIYSINANHVSRPRVLGPDQILTVTPDVGAYAVVEYTAGTLADVQNGVATWLRSNRGDAIGQNTYKFPTESYYRVSPVGGNAVISVDDQPSATSTAAVSSALSKAIRANPNSAALIALPEGQAMTVTGAAASAGSVQRLDSTGAVVGTPTVVGVGTLPQIGAFAGTQRFLITCTAGSIDATVGDAVLGLPLRNKTNRTVLWGDSLAYQSGPFTTGNTIYQPNIGWFAHLNRLLNGAFDVVANAGIIGQMSADIVSRFATDVAPYRPGIIVYIGGTNDPINGVDPLVTIANAKQAYDYANSIGAQFWISSPPPLYKLTTLEASRLQQIGIGYRKLAKENPGCVYLPVFEASIDPLSATGYAKAGYLLSDNTHFTEKGRRAVANFVLPYARQSIADCSTHASSVIETKTTNAGNRNLLSNPLFTGTPVAGVAPSWQVSVSSGSATLTPTVVARPDGIGFMQRVVCVFNTASDDNLIRTNDSTYTRILNLDELQGEIFLNLTGFTGLFRCSLRLSVTVGGVTYDSIDNSQSAESYTQVDQGDWVDVPLRTGKLTIPALGAITAANLTLQITSGATGGGTVDVSRAEVLKLN